MTGTTVEVQPLTPERWADLSALFGEHGAQGGCWCMWWRLRPKDYAPNAGKNNEQALKALVDARGPVGLLAYLDGGAVGWCSVAPREQLLRIPTSATWKPVDDLPVWAISCFFVEKRHRHQGISSQLLSAAVEYARRNGGGVVEAYPKDLAGATGPEKDRSLYFGTAQMFKAAGFEEVARRHPVFPIMRLRL